MHERTSGRGTPTAAEVAAPDRAEAARKAEAFGLPLDPLDDPPDDPAVLSSIPLELMVRFECIPLREEDDRLVVAFGRLDDVTRVDELEFHLGRPIEAVVAPRGRVSDL